MINAKVFISHSARTDDVNRHLEAICDCLEAAGWTVRLDRTGLDVGDGWRSKLFDWMDEVHAAVLLVSRSALESKFVPIELSVLSFRHMREQNFPLLPVLVDLADCQPLEQGMIGELQLTEIQCLAAEGPDETATQVALRLQSQFDSSGRPRTPLEILKQNAAILIKQAKFSEEQLVEVAHVTAGFSVGDSAHPESIFADFAHQLVSVDFSIACDALVALADRRTSNSARGCLLELLDLVTPFWVTESEAAKVARYALAEREHRGFLLSCCEPWAAHSHICRSSVKPLGTGWQVCELPAPECEDEMAWIWQQLEIALTPVAAARRRVGVQGVRRRLERLEERNQPLFLLFPPEWIPSPELLTRLRAELPTLTVFATGCSEELEGLRPHVWELLSQGESRELDVCDTYDLTKVRLTPAQMSV